MIWGPLIAYMLSQPSQMRCTVRVSAKGLAVDGDKATPAQVVERCKESAGAVVTVTDDAPAGAWPALESKLTSVHVRIFMRGLIDDRVCLANPLAKGCD